MRRGQPKLVLEDEQLSGGRTAGKDRCTHGLKCPRRLTSWGEREARRGVWPKAAVMGPTGGRGRDPQQVTGFLPSEPASRSPPQEQDILETEQWPLTSVPYSTICKPSRSMASKPREPSALHHPVQATIPARATAHLPRGVPVFTGHLPNSIHMEAAREIIVKHKMTMSLPC